MPNYGRASGSRSNLTAFPTVSVLRERKRRYGIRTTLLTLRDSVPGMLNTKVSNANILKVAIGNIRKLTSDLDSLKRGNDEFDAKAKILEKLYKDLERGRSSSKSLARANAILSSPMMADICKEDDDSAGEEENCPPPTKIAKSYFSDDFDDIEEQGEEETNSDEDETEDETESDNEQESDDESDNDSDGSEISV